MDIGNHGLSCPGPEEYAALALHMQCSALALDALLTEQQAALNLISDRPTITLIPSAIVMDGAEMVGNLFDTVEFSNSAFLTLNTDVDAGPFNNDTGIAIGSGLGATPTVPYLRGWYEFGVYAEGIATAIVASQSEFGYMYVFDKDGTLLNYPLGEADEIYNVQDSTGTVRLNVAITAELNGVDGVIYAVNLGPDVNWQTASSMWVRYLGPSELVEVA